MAISEEPKQEQQAPSQPQDFKIPVVVNEPDVAKAVAQLAAANKFKATMTTSGAATIRQHNKHLFELVPVDMAMPEMNGWQVLADLKKKENPPKVVIMTSHVQQEGEFILLDKHADGYLIKPIDADRITKMLRTSAFSPSRFPVYWPPFQA